MYVYVCSHTYVRILCLHIIITLLGPPSRVGNLRNTSVSTNNVTIVWDEPFASQKAPVVQFHVLYGPRDCASVTESDMKRMILTKAKVKGVTLSDLQDGTVYCVHVFAVSLTGQGETTNIEITTQGDGSYLCSQSVIIRQSFVTPTHSETQK